MQTERVEKADMSLIIIYYYFILLFLYYFKIIFLSIFFLHCGYIMKILKKTRSTYFIANIHFANITKVFKQTIIHYILRSKIKEKKEQFLDYTYFLQRYYNDNKTNYLLLT